MRALAIVLSGLLLLSASAPAQLGFEFWIPANEPALARAADELAAAARADGAGRHARYCRRQAGYHRLLV